MKRFNIAVVCVTICTLIGLTVISRAGKQELRPTWQVRNLPELSFRISDRRDALVTVREQTVPVASLSSGYGQRGKIDKQGNIFFKYRYEEDPLLISNLSSTDRARRERTAIVRVGTDGRSTTIAPPSSGQLNWHDFAIGSKGILVLSYEMNDSRGRIVTIDDEEGNILSQFDTPEYVPFAISVATDGSIWTIGTYASEKTIPTNRLGAYTQIRRYRPTGQLISIPVGGFEDSADARRGMFVAIGDTMRFVTPLGHTTLAFRADGTVGAEQHLNAAVAVSQTNEEWTRAVLGATPLGEQILWFGVKAPKGKRQLARSFAYVTNSRHEVQVPEHDLPSQYGGVAGSDDRGQLLFFKNGQLLKVQFSTKNGETVAHGAGMKMQPVGR